MGFLCLIAIITCFLSLMKLDALAADTQTTLSGTQQPMPLEIYDYKGPADFARLLDVGTCFNSNDESISYVPPLDGSLDGSSQMMCLDTYQMKFVLFDFQLINLKAFDAVTGFFTVELQMVLHWLDNSSNIATKQSIDNCTFLCDTTSAQPLCCDEIWVPPLRLPGCTINAIQSITPTPYVKFTYQEGSVTENVSRRLWYLNIDATCAAKPDFHNFPFDVQKLTIDVINPYASRTWFQLNKGFLKHNVGKEIAGIDLNPDLKTDGWDINNLLVSISCGTQQSWLQTFLTQDYLLSILNDNTKPYSRQQESIMDNLNPDIKLECAEMKSVKLQQDLLSNPAYILPYITTRKDYDERVNITLQRYTDCVESSGYNFYLNTSASSIDIPDLGTSNNQFEVSEPNIERSFGLLNLTKEQPTKISFQCAIAAVANLTTPGIRIIILVHRFKKFYVVKLILPTVACVAFTFSAVGIRPDDLMGRLTVVVPSAIALTALQGLVVATDVPAVAYIAPTTYIMLISYIVQLLVAFESVCMNIWLNKWQKNPNSRRRLDDANIILDQQDRGLELIRRDGGRPSESQPMNKSNGLVGEPTIDTLMIRKYDLVLMGVLAALYIVAILGSTIAPWLRSRRMESTLTRQYVNMWDDT